MTPREEFAKAALCSLLLGDPPDHDDLDGESPLLAEHFARDAVTLADALVAALARPRTPPPLTTREQGMVMALHNVRAALDNYPHWTAGMPGHLLGVIRDALDGAAGVPHAADPLPEEGEPD